MAGSVTSAITDQAKQNFLKGVFAFADTYKCALISSTAIGTYNKSTLGAGTPGTGSPTTTNLGSDECAPSGSYVSGGFTLTPAVTLSNDTAVLSFTVNPSWTTATLSAMGCMIYDSSQSASANVIAVISFGGTVASTNGTFTITLPTADSVNGLIRLA